MSYVNYDGVMVEDIWGKTYLISNCPFARMDLGEDHLSSVQDVIFGRQFLYKLQPEWQQDAVFRKLYLQAMPWCQKLSSLNTQQVVQAVIDFFISGKLLVWQLTDGWSKPPAGSPGIGGLVPLAGSVLSATVSSNTTSTNKSRSAPPFVAAPIAQIQSHESPIDNIVGGAKQVVNDLIAMQRAGQAEFFAEQGIIKVTDTQTNQLLTPEEVRERYAGIVTFDIDTAEQAGADAIQEVPGYSAALLAVELASSKFKKLLTDPKGLYKELTKVVKDAVKDARSPAEALGHLGGNHAVDRLGLKPDDRFVNRYHGPDGMYYDANGKRVEAEFKGYNKDSTVLSSNTNRQKQGSNEKNRTRAKKMTDKKSKVDQPSNRQGGAYTQDEQALWDDIKLAGGKKNHLAVFTNTETGQVRAFSQDKDGNLIDKVLDEPIPDFNDAKAIINNAFSRKK
ncbi:hypothetical protein [Shewanella baltica]|uniref:Uncharacterized protein n=1 Tax=Shewanella baltica (strain OS155 / ATCC BAA-1091) TaxID=325240 RepID=A3D517_SHEB5|nr:hypothetical protein [Shewanella baltica]ABN61830.1 hypothetical protein Sbal_2337 [Shewanella baltica OS155]AEH14178.1 hypothetical protein Sbal117_2469 [Shewanella baltica OS117]